MVVKVVTDSTSDLPPQLAKELGITVVPAYVRFGGEVYRNRVDITARTHFTRGYYMTLSIPAPHSHLRRILLMSIRS